MKLHGNSVLKLTTTLVVAAMMCSCSTKYFFAPSGTLIPANDYFYFNDSLKFALAIPGDFAFFTYKAGKGLRVKSLYKNDKKVLKKARIAASQTEILFSAEPIIEPDYHLIALLIDTAKFAVTTFDARKDHDTMRYYVKEVHLQGLDRYEVKETVVPYKNKYLLFIYYGLKTSACPFCDVDYITRDVSRRLQQEKTMNFAGSKSECDTAKNAGILSIDVPGKFLQKDKPGLILVNKVDQTDKSRHFETFGILEVGMGHIDLNVCAGNYLIKYVDFDGKILWEQQK